ncbi:MAG: DUF4912 domain-containing protein [Planctomycetia bacterium]|nr:DUF4912 domain-containing protein [Planctomycetia bacterium]
MPPVTAANLKEKPVRDLARLAKQHGVAGWHSMRKDQLIRALIRKAKARRPADPALRPASPKSAAGEAAAKAVRDAAVARRIDEARTRLQRAKNLATPPEGGKPSRAARDRMVVMVRGPHWLHAFWEVTPRSIARAEAALGPEWHAARPVLRLLQLENGLQASPSERVIRTIPIHGGVKNWFIDIREPIRCRVEVGYATAGGRFHGLARSNAVTTPAGLQADTLDAHWADIAADCEKIYAMSGGFSPENNSTELQELFEERLRRPMGPPAARAATQGDGDGEEDRVSDFQLEVDAEMIVYGATQPGSYVTLQGEPVKVQPDGTFRVRVDLPNKRQVLPIIASTADGVERQTVVLAVERNTKSMEPLSRDSGEF